MSELWTYREEFADAPAVALIGYDVEATDGHIGKIDEESTEVGDAFLVVDTGFWIFGKKRVIPARAVKQINTDDEVVFIDMTKEQVRESPDHHAEWLTPEHREPFIDYYGPFTW